MAFGDAGRSFHPADDPPDFGVAASARLPDELVEHLRLLDRSRREGIKAAYAHLNDADQSDSVGIDAPDDL